jgi:hypothetical protein
MDKLEIKFNLDQTIYTPLAFVFILILSFLTAWYTVNAGEGVINMARQSEAFNLETRMRMQELQKTKDNLKSVPIQGKQNSK